MTYVNAIQCSRSGETGRWQLQIALAETLNWTVLKGCVLFFFSSRRRHTRLQGDWSSDVCSSDLTGEAFNLSMEEVATRVAIELKADKLIFMTEVPGIRMDPTGPADETNPIDTEQIGRASCRERV